MVIVYLQADLIGLPIVELVLHDKNLAREMTCGNRNTIL